VGDFNGQEFVRKNKSSRIFWEDEGMDFGYPVFCQGVPEGDGRRLQIGWMNNTLYQDELPDTTWNGSFSLPRTTYLFTNSSGTRLSSYPMQEFISTRSKAIKQDKLLIVGKADISHMLANSTPYLDLELAINKVSTSGSWNIVLSNSLDESIVFGYDYERNRYFLDRTLDSVTTMPNEFYQYREVRLPKRKSQTFVRVILDKSSIEVFFDLGEVVFTAQLFPKRPIDRMYFNAPKDAIVIEGMAYQLTSIWEEIINE
jgi:sucrose-6-phosphate hydrolase SacC (GH32 family)